MTSTVSAMVIGETINVAGVSVARVSLLGFEVGGLVMSQAQADARIVAAVETTVLRRIEIYLSGLAEIPEEAIRGSIPAAYFDGAVDRLLDAGYFASTVIAAYGRHIPGFCRAIRCAA